MENKCARECIDELVAMGLKDDELREVASHACAYCS